MASGADGDRKSLRRLAILGSQSREQLEEKMDTREFLKCPEHGENMVGFCKGCNRFVCNSDAGCYVNHLAQAHGCVKLDSQTMIGYFQEYFNEMINRLSTNIEISNRNIQDIELTTPETENMVHEIESIAEANKILSQEIRIFLATLICKIESEKELLTLENARSNKFKLLIQHQK